METEKPIGWQNLMTGYPWFAGKDCYPLPAYSEFMPPPFLGRGPLGGTDSAVTEIHVDAKTGAVVKSEGEGEEEEAEEKEADEAKGAEEPSIADMQSMAKMAKVTMAAALQTALQAAPGTALAVELENEGGQLIFSFDILPSLSASELKEIHIDAKTGLVIKAEIEK